LSPSWLIIEILAFKISSFCVFLFAGIKASFL
jgi:hypothetical protein